MRVAVKETKVFKFSELNDAAKNRARDWYREGALDYEWWDFVYEDAQRVAEILGIDLDRKRGTSPAIYFSGFWSQGDGACFEGSYAYNKGASKRIREYAPQDSELHAIADALQEIQRPAFYGLSATMVQGGHYMHSGCMSVRVEDSHREWGDPTLEQEGEITDQMRAFADWIYSRLESEYEWLMSDENVDESIDCNEYEFTESGDVY